MFIVLRKETALPRWRAMDRRWNRKTVSLVSWVISDCGASANLLDYLNSHVIPCACCFYGNGAEHVCACQLGILGNLVLCRCVNCVLLLLLLLLQVLLSNRQSWQHVTSLMIGTLNPITRSFTLNFQQLCVVQIGLRWRAYGNEHVIHAASLFARRWRSLES